MDYTKIGLFNMVKNKMHYEGERQALIAKNIANANTPNYQPSDLKKANFNQLLGASSKKLEMASTNPSHIKPMVSSSYFDIKKQKSFETTPNGNGVNLEEESLKLTENNVDHQTTTTVYRKMVDLFKLATTGR